MVDEKQYQEMTDGQRIDYEAKFDKIAMEFAALSAEIKVRFGAGVAITFLHGADGLIRPLKAQVYF
jgi:hypothetical protein